MKKTDKIFWMAVFAMSALFIIAQNINAQTIIYTEDMGTPTSSSVLIQNYSGWQDASVGHSGDGTCDIRTSRASSGYERASAGGNVLINNQTKWFQVYRLNTLDYQDVVLSFGLRKAEASNGSDFRVEVSADSVSWTRLTLTDTLESGSGTSGWYWVQYDGVPSCENLHIRFSNDSTTEYRLDDLLLTGTPLVEPPHDSTAVLSYDAVPFCTYPNPTTGFVNLRYGNLQIQSMELQDVYGRVALQWSSPFPDYMDLSVLPRGTYLLVVRIPEGVFHRKIVRY